MKGSRKEGAPEDFLEWLNLPQDNWKPSYGDMTSVAANALRQTLHREQRGLCVYCGRRLSLDRPGKTYHVEHFRPQKPYTELATEYTNMFLSCGQEGEDGKPSRTCGRAKGGWFDESKHVYPEYDACTNRFTFTLNGKIETRLQGDEAASEMIRKLALDHDELNKERETVFNLLDSGEVTLESYWDEGEQLANGYAHIVFQYYGRVIP